ncbi:hypothetical protein MON38_00900 [Hymenobacter sp. DH14]|uniref:Uncharacterized protein n=1 Tax=Hymenobacter cyanobacteriorum TaxID=2926463 RepID=A0A9X1VFP5_9BACT|nr:hypothetical protein [Hymenobacter cyanobacteriorum]MCI1185960.1 hypothetical protein [Hymenobacter cyanobacteriorum]
MKKLLLFLLFIASCQKMKSGQHVAPETIQLVESIGLLSKDEHIVLYYSNFRESSTGSFVTDKRIAHYWLEKKVTNNRIESAYYSDIISIIPRYKVPDFDSPYIEITKRNGDKFRAYMEGSDEEKYLFYEQALALWHKRHAAGVQP